MFRACPNAQIISIDFNKDPSEGVNTHCGYRDAYRHAEKILKGKNWQLWVADSHELTYPPPVDLCYVDGDHTTAGCMMDLDLCAGYLADKEWQSRNKVKWILCDDYYTEFPPRGKEVQVAIDSWLEQHEEEWSGEFFDNGSTGLALLTRK